MAKLDLARYLADSAGELIAKAERLPSADVSVILDEAEELLALGASILGGSAKDAPVTREAA